MTLPLHVLTMAPNDPKNVCLSAPVPSRHKLPVPCREGNSASRGNRFGSCWQIQKKDTRMQLQLEDLKISMFSGKFSVNERHHNPKEQRSKFGKKKLL